MGARCLAPWCPERREGKDKNSMWWVDYGCCSMRHTMDYYGEDVP